MIMILCAIWLGLGALGAYLAKMDRVSHPVWELFFGWALGISLGPICLVVVILTILDPGKT